MHVTKLRQLGAYSGEACSSSECVGIITIVRDIDPYDLHAWLALVRD